MLVLNRLLVRLTSNSLIDSRDPTKLLRNVISFFNYRPSFLNWLMNLVCFAKKSSSVPSYSVFLLELVFFLNAFFCAWSRSKNELCKVGFWGANSLSLGEIASSRLGLLKRAAVVVSPSPDPGVPIANNGDLIESCLFDKVLAPLIRAGDFTFILFRDIFDLWLDILLVLRRLELDLEVELEWLWPE